MRDALRDRPLDLYSLVNASAPHWPYPGGFLPWIALSGWLSDATGLRFDGLVQTAPIAADAALAWLVQAYLGRRGADDRTRLGAAALILAGPVFLVVSGYHGQLDAAAILPAVLAFWAWESPRVSHRALVAGLLIGLAGSIKAVPLVVAVALLPSSRSVREGLTLLIAAALVPLVSVAPFLVHDLHGTLDGLRGNRGVPGFGGISLLVQPDLSAVWLGTRPDVALSPASRALFDHGTPFAVGALLVTGAVLLWRRVEPLPASVLMWLTVYAFGINFGITYLIWGMPFFLLAGYLRAVLLIQAALVIPLALLYIRIGRDLPLHWVYTPILLALWIGLVAWFVVAIRRVVLPAADYAPGVAAREP